MFVKLFLFLICAVVLNISEGSSENNTEVKSDCGDLISCVGAWIGEFLLNDKKHVPARQIKESNLFSAMGDILSEVSSFIMDTFKNISKDKTLIKNDLNKTIIDVQTFTFNDTFINPNQTGGKVKVLLLNNVEESNKTVNHTKALHMTSDNKDQRDYSTVSIFEVLKPKGSGESSNEESAVKTLRNNTNLAERDSDQMFLLINVTFSPNKDEEKENVIPLDIPNLGEKIMSNITENGSLYFGDISKKVTYETPINGNNFEIKAKNDTYTAQKQNIVNNTVNTIFDIKFHSNLTNSSLKEIVTQTVLNSTESVILSQMTEDYVNRVTGPNLTYFDIITKGESISQEYVTNLTKNDDINDLKNQKDTAEKEIHIVKSVTLNRTVNVDVDYNINTQFDIESLPNTKLSENITFSQPTNSDNDKIENQYPHENEISVYDNFNYNIDGENGTDYLELDYISIYKDVTVENVEYEPPIYIPTTSAPVTSVEAYEDNGIETIFPWIATVFVKSNSADQFEYICDGSLVSARVVLTAARCLNKLNVTENAKNVLIILGKKSLQATGPSEKIIRVKQIKLHENFTDVEGNVDNDLAIIVLDETVAFDDYIQLALLSNNEDDDDVDAKYSATTGWHITGRLTPIYLKEESRETCVKNTGSVNTFCAQFGDSITTCPSFGGVFVSKKDTKWRLQGISTGRPTSTGVCFDKNVTFTNIKNYFRWITENVNMNKDD